jgi:Mce-associated membrane protein
MMSTDSLERILPDSSGEPDPPDDGGEESLNTGDDQPAADDADAPADSADADGAADTTGRDDTGPPERLRTRLARLFGHVILPAAALLLACAAGYLKWVDGTARDAEVARAESVQAAIDSTVAMLSYRPDTVAQNLAAARDRMTGAFRDSYTSLTNDVVIPGAKQRQISAVTTVPAAASVSATPTHAVVLVFVNQTTIIGNDAPSDTASRVKVTLEKVHGRWLISQFDPI